MRCEEQHYDEISTPSITKYPWFTFKPSSIKENDKVLKANLLKRYECESMPFTFSIMKMTNIRLTIETNESVKE